MKLLNKDLLKSRIDEIAQYDIAENNLFGSAYLVYQNGEVVCKKYFGMANTDKNIPVGEDTIFRLASMTKPVTAIAILILIDRGLISLSEPIKKHLPEFENIHIISDDGTDFGKAKKDVTVMHLLTHTAGIGSYSSDKPINMTTDDKKSIKNTVKFFVNAGLDYEPFTKNAYSPFAAFDILAAIAEKVTGTDYEEFLKRELFMPCNMKDTTFMPSEEQWNRMTVMHNKVDGKSCIGHTDEHCVFQDFPSSHKLAGAGLVSTLNDYFSFARLLLNKGKTGDRHIISEKTFNLMPVAYVPYEIMPQTESWGLGVRVITESSYGTLPVGSFGWSGAYGTHFWIDPENDIAAVFMKNSRFDGGAGNQSARRFEEAVYHSLYNNKPET